MSSMLRISLEPTLRSSPQRQLCRLVNLVTLVGVRLSQCPIVHMVICLGFGPIHWWMPSPLVEYFDKGCMLARESSLLYSWLTSTNLISRSFSLLTCGVAFMHILENAFIFLSSTSSSVITPFSRKLHMCVICLFISFLGSCHLYDWT